MSVEMVFFDGDQTLWDFRTVMRRALAAIVDEVRRLRPGHAAELDVDTLIADRDEVARDIRSRGLTFEQIRSLAFGHTLERLGLADDELVTHLTETYLEHRFSGVEPYLDVRPALSELARHYRLGLLSNGNSYPERCGLPGVFDVVVIAQDHDWEKPDPRLYAVAAQRAGCTAARLVMVGDSLRDDVVGAQVAGWRGIWLNRDGLARSADVRPDAELRSLSEARSKIAHLVGR